MQKDLHLPSGHIFSDQVVVRPYHAPQRVIARVILDLKSKSLSQSIYTYKSSMRVPDLVVSQDFCYLLSPFLFLLLGNRLPLFVYITIMNVPITEFVLC